MTRYMLAHMLKKPKVGKIFTLWPLHITQIPWFETDHSVEELVHLFAPVASEQKTLQLHVGNEASFGPGGDIPVYLISDDTALSALHQKLLAVCDVNNLVIEDREYIGKDHTSHITDRKRTRTQSGDPILIDSLDFVEAISENPKERKSVHRFYFSTL